MFVNDRQNRETLGCRSSLRLFRCEADSAEGKAVDDTMYKVCLSRRGLVELKRHSKTFDTHYPSNRRI